MIYIVQCLCPNRHAIFAIAYDPKDIAHNTALVGFQGMIEDMVKEKVINPCWCGICRSPDWTYEQRRTKFETMEEAKPEMERLQQEQMLTRMQIEERKAAKN